MKEGIFNKSINRFIDRYNNRDFYKREYYTFDRINNRLFAGIVEGILESIVEGISNRTYKHLNIVALFYILCII